MANTMRIEGMSEALAAVRSIGNALGPRDVEKVLYKGAKIIRNDAARRVRAETKVKTGRLRRSLKAKIGKRYGSTIASAFAAVDRKMASHAHLIEFGHAQVVGGRNYKNMAKRRRRVTIKGRVVGFVPARPFMRPAAEATQVEVAAVVSAGLKELLGKGVKAR